MSIQYTTLHPEGDTGTDLYPKTDVSQIADLPVSAQKQLYQHRIEVSGTGVTCFISFINSTQEELDSTTWTEFEAKLRQVVQGFCTCSGTFLFTGDSVDNIPKYSNGVIRVLSDTIEANVFNTGNNSSMWLDITTYLSSLDTININDRCVAVGSNAG